jgi:sporulation protein YlmC with PRC-barrel domain
MREGSYYEIKPGMKVVGRDGNALGTVKEVIADEATDIFIGLAVSPNLFVHPLKVPGELVDRVHHNVVHVCALENELQPYNTPEERHHDAVEANEVTAP